MTTASWIATGLPGVVVRGALGGSPPVAAAATGGGDGMAPDDLARLVAAPALRRSPSAPFG